MILSTKGWLFCFTVFAIGIFLGATLEQVRMLLWALVEQVLQIHVRQVPPPC